jgi:membrane protein YdbS with pleckstrin-like domain
MMTSELTDSFPIFDIQATINRVFAEYSRRNDAVNDRKKESLRSWISFLRVVYRLVVILGMLFIVGTVILLVFVNIFPMWVLIFPVSLILFGVVLARVEYGLYRKLNGL